MSANATLAHPPTYRAPPVPKGQMATGLHPDWAGDNEVIVYFVYEAAEPRTLDEPGEPAVFDITACYIRGWDCFQLLSESQIEALETLIRESAE
jgi:hypothetical protein